MEEYILLFNHALTDEEYSAFLAEMDNIFGTEEPKNYKITSRFNIINGIAIRFPAAKMADVMKISVVARIEPDMKITIDPIKPKPFQTK